jgi:hypothetical protein
VGAALYGLHFPNPGDPLDAHNTIKPQQLALVDTLSAGLDAYVVEIPRRASKTTTILCLLLGRCKNRPGYQVTFSAQSGVKGSQRLREWKTRLDLINPPDDQDLPPWMRTGRRRAPSKQAQRAVALFGEELLPEAAVEKIEDSRRGFRILMGEVGKGIYFDNGSQLLVLKPDASAARGEAADASWLDEAQELDPEVGNELMAGLLPLQDTKPGASIIISGTAGEIRTGPFWEYVEKLRNGDPDVGGMDYAADPDVDWDVIEDEDSAIALLKTIHPGIGTLTTEDKMRKNWRKLNRPQWAREYLSMWPETFGVTVIAGDQWTDAALQKKIPKPRRVAFGLAIKPGGSVAAIVAAWRGDAGQAYIEVVDHRSGTAWLPKRMQELSRAYPGSTIAFDDIGEGKATSIEVQRLSPKPRLRMVTYMENASGCVVMLRELERGNLRHFDQIGLNTSVAVAAKREVKGEKGIWLWKPSEPGADITCLDAATRALVNWDKYFARSGNKLRPAFAA